MSNNDEKILKALEDLQADVKGLKSDVTTIKDVQQKQGKHLETLEAGQKALESGQQALKADVQSQGKRLEAVEAGQNALDLKVEAVHAYQKKAHDEIMGHVIDIAEIGASDQKILEKRIERIEKHLGLPPLK